MKTTTSTAPVSDTIQRGADQEAHKALAVKLKKLAQARTCVPEILAYDVLDIRSSIVSSLIEGLVISQDPHAVETRARIDAILEALHKVDARLDDGGEFPHDISDQYFDYAMAWGEAGYLLGLAVGMQLGPHAFAQVQR